MQKLETGTLPPPLTMTALEHQMHESSLVVHMSHVMPSAKQSAEKRGETHKTITP